MRILLAILIVGSAVLVQTPPPPAAAPIGYDEAVANEKKLFAADQQHDLDTINAIVADEFVDIARDGSSIGKAALLKEIPGITLLKYSQQNFRVTIMGPYAYSISYDSDATQAGAGGQDVRTQNALTSVWIKRNGRWQMLMHCRGEARPATGS